MENETSLTSGMRIAAEESFYAESDWGLLAKRCFDFFFAVVAFVIFLVPGLILALCIWLQDGHSPIFRQERIGRFGRPFMLYKFRSMRCDAEKDNRPELCHENDSRLTPIGAFIRNHHLDELPQLLNVLRGDMSFVGYRPERSYFIEIISKHNPGYSRLYALRPGLFSEATLYNGYTDTIEKMLTRLEMDLNYLENRSMTVDIAIIFKTSVSIISGKKF